MDTKSSGMKHSKYWKENKPSVENLIFSKTSFKNEGEINTFLNKQKVRDLLLAHSAYIGSMKAGSSDWKYMTPDLNSNRHEKIKSTIPGNYILNGNVYFTHFLLLMILKIITQNNMCMSL